MSNSQTYDRHDSSPQEFSCVLGSQGKLLGPQSRCQKGTEETDRVFMCIRHSLYVHVKHNRSIIKCHFNIPRIKATRIKDSKMNQSLEWEIKSKSVWSTKQFRCVFYTLILASCCSRIKKNG